MSYQTSDVNGTDFAKGSIDLIIRNIIKKMDSDIKMSIEKEFPEQSILSSLVCLRLIGEKFPKNLSIYFGNLDFEELKSKFYKWYELVHKKIPAKFREEVKEVAEKEFDLFYDKILKGSIKGFEIIEE